MDKLRRNYNFYEGSNETYEAGPLKRIIVRFEYILNTYLREFVTSYLWATLTRPVDSARTAVSGPQQKASVLN